MSKKMPARGMSWPYHFVLASTSPRRRELLKVLSLPFTVVSPGSAADKGEIDETPLPDEKPAALVQRLSRIKAQVVVANLSSLFPYIIDAGETHNIIVIAADTVVVLEGKVLGKPNNPAEATLMLKQLRQRIHYVYTGLTAVLSPLTLSELSPSAQQTGQDSKGVFTTRLHQSKIWMRAYTDAEIETYVASGAPLDKAGAYGIQDQTFSPVEQLEGCFASVMGLPLGELVAALRELGVSLPESGGACTQHIGTPCCQL
jgi:MAF protein